MELFGHVGIVAEGLHESGMSRENIMAYVKDCAAKLCLPDTIRQKIQLDGLIPFGRVYSHFTNGCGMIFPINEKTLDQKNFFCNEEYKPSIADGPTDFSSFIARNPHMFTKENFEWGICVLTHLNQDTVTDAVFQHLTVERFEDVTEEEDSDVTIYGKYKAKDQKVIYKRTGKSVSGDQFRRNIGLANELFHSCLWNRLQEVQITPEELIENAVSSFKTYYDEDMASSATKYLVSASALNVKRDISIRKELAKTGFAEEWHIDSLIRKLHCDGLSATNMLINHKRLY